MSRTNFTDPLQEFKDNDGNNCKVLSQWGDGKPLYQIQCECGDYDTVSDAIIDLDPEAAATLAASIIGWLAQVEPGRFDAIQMALANYDRRTRTYTPQEDTAQ